MSVAATISSRYGIASNGGHCIDDVRRSIGTDLDVGH